MTHSAELCGGDIHDDITECHADHVVVINGAEADALQVSQCHQQVLAGHSPAIGVLPVFLKQADKLINVYLTCSFFHYF